MKYLVLTAVLFLSLAACKRRPGQVPTHGDIHWNSNSVITASMAGSACSSVSLDPTSEFTTAGSSVRLDPTTTAKKSQVNSSPAATVIAQKTMGSPRDSRSVVWPVTKTLKRAHVRKEIPSALSNALWMTGIGLVGMVVMLLLFALFDTSVFFVLFGVVFLIGLISLLMYKVTHKQKIQN